MPDESSPPPEPSDAELLSRIGTRDRRAFGVLYGRYARSVFGLAVRRLDDRRDAEDAVQEAFAAIWRTASTYRPDRVGAGSWVYTVARRAIVDRLRRRSRAEADEDAQLEEPAAAWRMHRALEGLQPRERELIELVYWSGMSESEVAGYLELPPEAVTAGTRDALAHLASLLEGKLPSNAHELLLEAGPPPELPPALASVPDFGAVRRRERRELKRRAFLVVAAALAVAVAVAVGYAVAHRGSGSPAVTTVTLTGTTAAPDARATLELQPARQGNRSAMLSVVGLPKLPPRAVYDVYLLRPSKPETSCGTFTTSSRSQALTLTLNVPPALGSGNSWIVTREAPGGKHGTTVLRSS